MINNIPCRRARIFWNTRGDVLVAEIGDGKDYMEYAKSAGACFGFWQETETDEMFFRLAQQVANLAIVEGVEPAKIHEAFRVIPEYRAILPKDHIDSLQDDEADLLDISGSNFSRGYPI